jgi:hypothetical protein
MSQSPPKRRREDTTMPLHMLNLVTRSDGLTLEDLISDTNVTWGFTDTFLDYQDLFPYLDSSIQEPSWRLRHFVTLSLMSLPREERVIHLLHCTTPESVESQKTA